MARPPNRLFRLVLESHDGRAPGADSEEKHEPVSDIDTVGVDSLKALDPEWPSALEDEIVLVHRALFFAEFLADRNKVATTNANSEISNANCEFRDKGSSILNAARGSLHIEQGSSFVWSMSWPRVRIGKAT